MSSFADPETNVVPYSNRFLDLECASKIYPYQGTEQFWGIWDDESRNLRNGTQDSEWVLFSGVDEDAFDRDFLNSSDDIILKNWSSYDRNTRLLLVRMPASNEHEIARSAFDYVMSRKREAMGLSMALLSGLNATRYGDDGSSKQPDGLYFPARPPRSRTPSRDWPTVVLEVAVSEGPSKLMSDVRWWIRQHQGATGIVLTLRVDRNTPQITLEKWTRGAQGHPQQEVSITITKRANNTVRIENGPLIIPFEQILLRSPAEPREGDIVFDNQDLELIANQIWSMQDF
ncbi:hypothetical protein DTO164E3_1024 [Paecilomyces variotii]|nr:hypothetical protein DTO032I3_3688 [Paecilomyces variotii]KAJ9205771.1 hypothetical protein DTO164E3_1024 [Paecilomyces variotii]KAJ9278660.1 hypothetical protein DTO021D3_4569 [Paecilomyces variotii]KAJ9339660.1 hypothetical protein DTO027B6_7787 [Paecilomyces variotii]KAJ9375774.1 hypothetical protein DTO032I4_8879 [Paecilomyces variotii]